MDNELLQSIKALENARAELPRQSVDRYKESIEFKEGLKRMGRVTYEYGYRVALAHFHALHPDSKVEEDPFTIHPEDDLVPMERQQAGCTQRIMVHYRPKSPTSAYKTYLYLQAKMGHKANQTQAVKPTASPLLVVQGLVADIPTQVSVPDEVFDLILQVASFLCVMTVFPVKAIIPPFIAPLGV
ncbi:hypothetical protein B296_00026325 [Ensete ventricosum]|uniref:Uncharacterized protein n=1 Tax=Ensete ventricosum TaxID=4639 RepID=A0A426ZXV2_ENSVE|nr:hypothetical protein B296_00026325 [Ensete ventricosum]